MRFCQDHWDGLRKAIEDRGLSQFISGSGEKAVEKIQHELAGVPSSQETFDPLMAASFAIWSNALEMGGKYLLFGNPDSGEPYCPVCEAVKNSPPDSVWHDPAWWFGHAADEQLEHAKELGMTADPKLN